MKMKMKTTEGFQKLLWHFFRFINFFVAPRFDDVANKFYKCHTMEVSSKKFKKTICCSVFNKFLLVAIVVVFIALLI